MIAQTQFYVAEVEYPEWRNQISQLSEDDLLLYKLMCEFHQGKPVRARHPALILTEDDCTFVVSEGTQAE